MIVPSLMERPSLSHGKDCSINPSSQCAKLKLNVANAALDPVLALFQSEGVHWNGSTMGEGLRQAAAYYLRQRVAPPSFYHLPGAIDLEPSTDRFPDEKPFYVVDLGVVISQLHRWRRHFPRVEPFCKCFKAKYL
jgi:hypothetical protein